MEGSAAAAADGVPFEEELRIEKCSNCLRDLSLTREQLEPFNPYVWSEGWVAACHHCASLVRVRDFKSAVLKVICDRNWQVVQAKAKARAEVVVNRGNNFWSTENNERECTDPNCTECRERGAGSPSS